MPPLAFLSGHWQSGVMSSAREAKFGIGQIVRHRLFDFRGVIFDVDPEFNNTEEWYNAIPENVRPHKDQPFYHLLAENDETEYTAYVSEQNLLVDNSSVPVRHPQVREFFAGYDSQSGTYKLIGGRSH
jgi:heat shock protein HspQ